MAERVLRSDQAGPTFPNAPASMSFIGLWVSRPRSRPMRDEPYSRRFSLLGYSGQGGPTSRRRRKPTLSTLEAQLVSRRGFENWSASESVETAVAVTQAESGCGRFPRLRTPRSLSRPARAGDKWVSKTRYSSNSMQNMPIGHYRTVMGQRGRTAGGLVGKPSNFSAGRKGRANPR